METSSSKTAYSDPRIRAVACQRGELDLVERPEPKPGPGQCGSGHPLRDLRIGPACPSQDRPVGGRGPEAELRPLRPLRSAARLRTRVQRSGCRIRAEVQRGRGQRHPGRRASPAARRERSRHHRLSQHAPGAYAEQMLVQESMMMPVPNGLDPAAAALTEPMAVALHAVRCGEGRQARRGDRDRLRSRRPRHDPDAEGDRRSHRRGQRLLTRTAGPRGALRSRRRRRPVASLRVESCDLQVSSPRQRRSPSGQLTGHPLRCG